MITWQRADARLVTKRYSSQITQSEVTIVSMAGIEEFDRRKKAAN
jgi:hypothetical protein